MAVEEDPQITDLLEIHLKDLGCLVQKSFDGESGLHWAMQGGFSLIILDLMLPRMDGLEVCRRLRAKELRTPILMLTAKSEEIDKVLGLEMGADDYLTKPFGVREFIARVKAIFRRMEMSESQSVAKKNSSTLRFGDLLLDLDKHRVAIAGSYFLKSGMTVFFTAMAGSLLVGLIAIWLITRNLRQIIEVVRRFKEGDQKARIAHAATNDLAVLATTFNSMADTIEANIEKLKSVENLRRELIANVSHDLRTPLAIMQGYVETLLMKNDLPVEKRQEYLQIVLASSEKLARLIAQLFEYSKLEARQIQLQKEPFFIGELAQDIFQKYQILAKQKNIRLLLEQPNNLPLVFADLALVERVIQNLMDNALKFTPSGGEVKLALKETGKNVEVRIADTGPGFPESEQAAIFERYRKASTTQQASVGAGLGLAIAKKILELHDATIRVQSRLNEGTAFWFQLPAHRNG